MKYTTEELKEAKRQIDSTVHKLRKTIETLEAKENASRCKSQITLVKRRVKAFEIADYYIEKEIKKHDTISLNENNESAAEVK